MEEKGTPMTVPSAADMGIQVNWMLQELTALIALLKTNGYEAYTPKLLPHFNQFCDQEKVAIDIRVLFKVPLD
jgi:hypothetical protein